MKTENVVHLLGAVGLGAIAYWYIRPLGTKIQEGDEVYVSEIYPRQDGPALQGALERRYVLLVTNAERGKGVVKSIEDLPESFLGSTAGIEAFFDKKSVSRVVRRGNLLSGSV